MAGAEGILRRGGLKSSTEFVFMSWTVCFFCQIPLYCCQGPAFVDFFYKTVEFKKDWAGIDLHQLEEIGTSLSHLHAC